VKADAGARSEIEKEAFEWAIEYFRKCAEELKPKASKRLTEKGVAYFVLDVIDHPLPLDTPESLDNFVSIYTQLARKDELHLRGMCRLASILLERGDPLPKSLRSFVVEFLRDPGKKIAARPGPSGADLLHRNERIAMAIQAIVNRWKLKATRSAATGRASAASIAMEALAQTGLHLSEKAVNAIWDRWHKLVLKVTGD
jgi:hypothetical protein